MVLLRYLGIYQAKENHSRCITANGECENEDDASDKITGNVTLALARLVMKMKTMMSSNLKLGQT